MNEIKTCGRGCYLRKKANPIPVLLFATAVLFGGFLMMFQLKLENKTIQQQNDQLQTELMEAIGEAQTKMEIYSAKIKQLD